MEEETCSRIPKDSSNMTRLIRLVFFSTREERDQEARKIADELHIKWDGEDGDYMEAQSVTIDSLGQKWYHDYRGFYIFEIDLPILYVDKSKIPPYHKDDREGPVGVVSIFKEK